MDAVKFIKAIKQMLGAGAADSTVQKYISAYKKNDCEGMVKAAEQWASEHPVKTRQSEFLKLFPNAQTDSGCLNACPMDVFGNTGIDCNKQTCYECKNAFWLAEVEDV